MNDHNLDDLIIDNIEPKNTKAKSMLTIIALLIVVLIVAIILTSVVLEDPKSDQDLLQDTETEMVSPELTLENVGKVKKPKAEPKLNEIIEEELNKDDSKAVEKPAEVVKETAPAAVPAKPVEQVVEKPETKKVEITETFSQKPEVPAKRPETVKPSSIPSTTEKKVVTQKPKPTPVSSTVKYYIQVGAYKASPSKQIISSIKNSGFNYTIMTNNGTKKLLIGPYPDRKSVDVAIIRVKDRINKSAFVVKK